MPKKNYNLSFEAVFTNYKKASKQVKGSNFTVDRDHSYQKQGWSPTPADILVGI